MAYTTVNKGSLYQNTVLYLGNDTGQSITGVGFQPDLVWTKSRDNTEAHNVWDAARGVQSYLSANTNDAVSEGGSTGLSSFDSDGFTVGSLDSLNDNNLNFAAWNWKAGTTSGIATNGSTTITPTTYSFNATSKCSILKYSGNGVAGAKVAHGLGVTPACIIIKRTDSAAHWTIYHQSLSAEKKLYMNNNYAETDDTGAWNDTNPDTVNFTLGTENDVNNGSGTYVAYCFADVLGYQKFGVYYGNGDTNGAFAWTGFKPSLIIIKRSDTTSNWVIEDDKRTGYNPNNNHLYPSLSNAESAGYTIDQLSNGFKVRVTSADINASGGDYRYMAWGQTMVGTNNIPATAR